MDIKQQVLDTLLGNAPIDTNRPILENEDGSFSTEETTTLQDPLTQKWINIPTIVNGKRHSEEEALDLYMQGINKAVGRFDTLEEAVSSAEQRTMDIGKVRQKDRKNGLR